MSVYIPLTKRQKVVYEYLVNTPLSRQEIADKLFVTTGAVADHIKKIFDRTNAASRIELMHRHHVLKEMISE